MNRKRTILELHHYEEGEVTTVVDGEPYVRFDVPRSEDPSEDVVYPVVFLPHEDYEEFGRPDKVTLTLEPGDLLNGDDDDEGSVRAVESHAG